jgi:hypothetical protein
MARGKKSGPSRLDLRRQAEAAEARGPGEDEREEGDEEEPEEAEAEAEEGEGDEDGEGKKKKKKAPAKKKAAPKAKKPATKRVRTKAEVRQRAVWVVFDNSSKPVEKFPYNQKHDAEALLARKIQEKEGKATFYLNLVKEEIKDEK